MTSPRGDAGLPSVVRWLAWDPGDNDRDGAVEYKRPIREPDVDRLELEAEEIASHYAEVLYSDSAGEVGTEFAITVIAVHEDESESSFLMDIVVDFEPTFTASNRLTVRDVGTLDGAYVGPRGSETGGGRGKPDWLMQALVRDYSRTGDLIVDPFCGWGSTLAAAQSLRRRSIGIDVDADALAESRRRLSRPVQEGLFT